MAKWENGRPCRSYYLQNCSPKRRKEEEAFYFLYIYYVYIYIWEKSFFRALFLLSKVVPPKENLYAFCCSRNIAVFSNYYNIADFGSREILPFSATIIKLPISASD